jgi:hypothetical protein
LEAVNTLPRLLVSATWTGLSSITEQQAFALIDDYQKKAFANLPDNSAKQVVIQILNKANKSASIIVIMHSQVSFTPTTIQYDQNSGSYLCRAQTVFTPGSTMKHLTGEFLTLTVRNNGAAYIQKNDPQILDHIVKDTGALMLAVAPILAMTPNICDVKTDQYLVQRIPSGKILVTRLSHQCGQ